MTGARTCPLCGRPVMFVTTGGGRRIPLDAEPHPNGTVILRGDGHGAIVGIARTDPPTPRYLSHAATCEQSVARLPSRRG